MAYLCRQGERRGAASWNENLSWMNSHMPLCLRQPPDEGFSVNGYIESGWDGVILNKSENISRCLDPSNVQYVHTTREVT